MSDDFEKKIEKLSARIKQNPKDIECRLELGKTHFVCSRFDAAIETYKQVLLSDADNVSAYYNLGMAYQGRKDYAQAMEMFRQVLKLDHDNKPAQEASDKMVSFTLVLCYTSNDG